MSDFPTPAVIFVWALADARQRRTSEAAAIASRTCFIFTLETAKQDALGDCATAVYDHCVSGNIPRSRRRKEHGHTFQLVFAADAAHWNARFDLSLGGLQNFFS